MNPWLVMLGALIGAFAGTMMGHGMAYVIENMRRR